MDHAEENLEKIKGVIEAMVPEASVKLPLLEGYEERINGLKMELFHASQGIVALDRVDSRLSGRESYLRDELFQAYVQVRDLFSYFSVPTFDGDIMYRSNFWDLIFSFDS